MKIHPDQISIFDIVLDNEKVPTPSVQNVVIPEKKSDKVLCPFPIPTTDDIIKAISRLNCKHNAERVFTDTIECGAIAISNAVDLTQYDQREARYKEIISQYDPKEQQEIIGLYAKIHSLLSSVVYDNGHFNDYLGEIFSRLNLCNGKMGQVFTPYHISEFMAKACIGSEVIQRAANDEIISICDPCCGAGVMTLAAIDIIKNDYGVNYTRNCFFECSDIDIRCVHMAYLQLALAGAAAIVIHKNSITNEIWSIWKTPALIFQYSRFYKFINK